MLVDLPNITRSRRLCQGVYQSNWWNFELEFRGRQAYELDFPEFPDDDFYCIGVCDSPEQLLAKLPAAVTKGSERFVISMVRVDRDDQPPSGGWRWHKWGPYIGDYEPKHEYLFHESIDFVWTFHVYLLDMPEGPK